MSQRREDPDQPTEGVPTVAAPPAHGPPTQVGPYRILGKLGAGGMGEVWDARQTEPVRRRVALKIIKRGMDTEQVVARFEAERQALALMSHPNVAKVFDAGVTPRGRPYFAMEYVGGMPITEHCDRDRLSTRERLELFERVCAGVQHAHHKGIIHRDIKPSNVLVQLEDGTRAPKIIDFGVAKATAQPLTDRPLHTELGQWVGTPEYMSPEQADLTAQDIDTRTDVYALGVLLYELIVGALPFDSKELRGAGFDEIRRRIREDDPSKPSTRLGTLGDASTESAARRQVDVRTLRRELRGDLDRITMKALEKDRTRRYGSPGEMAEDVRRHLRNEPVLAGSPSGVYRTGKFLRRHRVGVTVTALLLCILPAFTITTLLQSRRIAREAETSERVSTFLVDMLSSVDPQMLGIALWKDLQERVAEASRGRGATEVETERALAGLSEALAGVNATDAALRLIDEQILARAGSTIEDDLSEQPWVAGRLEHTLGRTYEQIGLYRQAERHAERAVAIRREALGPEHPDTLRSRNRLGWVLYRQGRYPEAEALYLETLEVQRRVLGEEHPDALASMNAVANSHYAQGRHEEAEALYRETVDRRRSALGPEHPDTLMSMNNLALSYYTQGRHAEAGALHQETMEVQRRVLGESHPNTLASMNNLANSYKKQGRYAEAEALHRETVEIRSRALGEEHPNTLRSMNNLANSYEGQGRHAEAETLRRETLAIQRRVLGDDHPETLAGRNNLALSYSARGRHAEAEALYRENLSIQRRVLGDRHPYTINSLYNLGCIASIRGDPEGALGWLGEAVDHGHADGDWMARDTDLAPLHGRPEFEALVRRARQNAAARQGG